ncbi:hypothetical protein [Streptomyces sp. CB03911]|uniref:hypothetical protein n=1 Tax=Streptomyces sp. CB03911 TaxID=1804758 RepID=UPI0009405660|nr:hypothetical protein [Streptomyces sp. CB03911]OKI24400.1 hypothetical protein A6A07_05940 [Streptomyces sp. CB03911]
MIFRVTPEDCPPLGLLRTAGVGDNIVIWHDARGRSDFPRVLDAAMVGATRGALLLVEGVIPDGP